MQDWTGNTKSIYSAIGASNHAVNGERQKQDYYATEPKAVEILLQNEQFSHYVWECACAEGHISDVLKKNGYSVKSSDLIDRGYEGAEIADFLKIKKEDIQQDYSRDIITNPPYKYAKEFVEQALNISMESTKIAMFLKLTFLEGKARKKLFQKHPPKIIYVFSSRVKCAKNGVFEGIQSSAVCYAWFVWEKGFNGDPVVKWVN